MVKKTMPFWVARTDSTNILIDIIPENAMHAKSLDLNASSIIKNIAKVNKPAPTRPVEMRKCNH